MFVRGEKEKQTDRKLPLVSAEEFHSNSFQTKSRAKSNVCKADGDEGESFQMKL